MADGANFRTSLVGNNENTFYRSMNLMLLKNNSFDQRQYNGVTIKDIKERSLEAWKGRGGEGTFEDYVKAILTPGYNVDPADIDILGIAASWAMHKPVIIDGDGVSFSSSNIDNTKDIITDGAQPVHIIYNGGKFLPGPAPAPAPAPAPILIDASGPASGPAPAAVAAAEVAAAAATTAESKGFLTNPIVDSAAASIGVGTAAGTAGAAAAGVLGSGLGVAAGVGAAAGLGAAGVGALGAYGIDAFNRSSMGKSTSKGAAGIFSKLRAGLGSTSAALKAARDQLVKGINLDVNIAGERVRLVTSGFNFKRHPDIASINDYYEDAGDSQIALINKYFGKGSDFKADDPAALCDESDKNGLMQGLERRLSTLQEDIKKFYNNETFSVQEVAKISHANRLIALIKKIQSAKGPCETLSETGTVVETPGVDTVQEERIEKIVKKFAFIVLKYFDPSLPEKGPYKDLVENVEKVSDDPAYVAGRANKPVFVQRILGLEADLNRLLMAKQDELLQKLKDLLPNVDLDLDAQIDGQDPTPYDKVLKIMTFCVDNYTRSSAEIARLTVELNAAASTIGRLEDELREAVAAAAIAATAAAAAAERAATDLANEIADKQAVASNLDAMTRERDAAVAQNMRAAAEAAQARDAAAAQVTEIQASLTAAQADFAAATAAKESAENALAAAQAAMAAAQEAATSAAAERDAARAELAAKTAELAGKISELEALQGGKAADAAATSGIQAELEKIKGELAQTTTALATAKAEAADAAAAAQAAADKAAAELRDAIEARATAENDAKEVAANMSKSSEDYNAQKARVAALERELADVSNKHTGAAASSTAELAAAAALSDSLQRDLIAARAELEPLQTQLAAAKEESKNARAQLKACDDAAKDHQDKYKALITHSNDTIEKEKAKADAELASLKNSGKSTDAMISQLKADAAAHADRMASLEDENRRLTAENLAKTDANKSLAAEKDAILRKANAQIATDLAAISAALDSGAPMPRSSQLQTLIDRINGLRGNKEAFNKNMCLLSNYVNYFMKLLFSNNKEDYNVLLDIVDKIRGSGSYMDVLNKLDPFLKIERADSATLTQAQKSEISAYYNPPPSTKVMLEQKLGSPGSQLGFTGTYRTLTINDYLALFIVASQKYMQSVELPCEIPEAIRDPSTLGSRSGRIATVAPTPVTVAPRPVSVAPRVKGSPGNPWTDAEATTALQVLNSVLKVQKGTGRPPPGSPADVKQYIRDNNRPNQTLLDAYCAYESRDSVICSKYTSVKRELNAASRF